MTQKELEQKVIDAEGRVAKREAVLKKHNSQLAKMIEKGADRFDISIKREDIKSATSKLAEARETLANWQDKLNTRITRDAYLEANTPEIPEDAGGPRPDRGVGLQIQVDRLPVDQAEPQRKRLLFRPRPLDSR